MRLSKQIWQKHHQLNWSWNETCLKGRQYQFAPLRQKRTKFLWSNVLHRIEIVKLCCYSRKTRKFSGAPKTGLFMNTRPALETASLTSELFKKSPCCSWIGAWAIPPALALLSNLRYAMRKLREVNVNGHMQNKQEGVCKLGEQLRCILRWMIHYFDSKATARLGTWNND